VEKNLALLRYQLTRRALMGFLKTDWGEPRDVWIGDDRHETTLEYTFAGHSPVCCIIEQARRHQLWILMRDGLLVIAALTKIDEVALTNAAKRKSVGWASGGQTSTADQVWIDGPRDELGRVLIKPCPLQPAPIGTGG
jgi:hypothetical protein